MAVPILPILGAISRVAATAWDTYNGIKRAKETALAQKGSNALLNRVEKLEDVCLEQARTLSELSKDMEQFAQAMQKRQTWLTWIACISLLMAGASAGMVLFGMFK